MKIHQSQAQPTPRNPRDTTVVVGMSGGVDSSVAALLLKEQGYSVIGLFMKNWDENDENGSCPAARDYEDVARVCEQIDIPFTSVEFIEEYRAQVFEQFLSDYRAGLTPNPDVLCNREIKFKAFFEKALQLGGEMLATGHYCRIEYRSDSLGSGFRLFKGLDPGKDQSYFLNAIDGKVLDRVLFPIGHLLKSEVREHARRVGLKTSEKKDSTGICFIGERDFRPFLSRYLQAQPGPFCHLDGTRVGQHLGSAYYTIGQRKGLTLGGQGDPWFVVAKDTQKNIVYVERGEEHPALWARDLWASDVSWIAGHAPQFPTRVRAKVRYRQKDQECLIESAAPGEIYVQFAEPQRAITPGQFVVFYDADICLGGGVIRRVGPTLADGVGLTQQSLSHRTTSSIESVSPL